MNDFNMEEFHSRINLESQLIFWGVPLAIIFISFLFIRKIRLAKIIWLCILATLIICNKCAWNHKEFLYAQMPPNHIELGPNIGYTIFTDSEAVALFIFSLTWYLIRRATLKAKEI